VQIRIEAISPDDAASFLEVVHRAFESLRGRLDPPSGAHDETIESIRQTLGAGGGFLARAGQEIVGCARWRIEPDHLYGGRVGVLPAWRGRGVGAALVRALEDAARAAGRWRVEVEVREPLADNLRFFERLGYRRIGLHPHPRGADRVVRLLHEVG
jgi:GNAT superfamily N-acetyltransferase